MPTEFEHDAHFLFDGSGTDIESIAETGIEGGHDHGVSTCVAPTARPDCSCTAAGTLDCTDQTAITNAWQTLVQNNCNSSCTCYDNTACRDAFFVIDLHHSGCNATHLPQYIEEGYHDYEPSCQRCYTPPYQDPNYGSCGVENCTDSEGVINQWNILTNGTFNCSGNGCQSAICSSAWNAVVAHHDGCCFSDIPQVIEDDYHTWETTCVGGCNLNYNTSYVVCMHVCPHVCWLVVWFT